MLVVSRTTFAATKMSNYMGRSHICWPLLNNFDRAVVNLPLALLTLTMISVNMVVLAEVSISSTNHLPSAQTIEHEPRPFQLYFHHSRFCKLLWANLQNVNQKTFTKTRSDMPDYNNSLITSFA